MVGWRSTGACCYVPLQGGDQDQVPGWSWSRAVTLDTHSCHLDADWASGNRWAGRRCVVPSGRVIAGVVCFPPILTTLVFDGRKRSLYDTAWVTPGHDCLCSNKCGQGAAVGPQTNYSIRDGVIGLWSRVAPHLSPWCAKERK